MTQKKTVFQRLREIALDTCELIGRTIEGGFNRLTQGDVIESPHERAMGEDVNVTRTMESLDEATQLAAQRANVPLLDANLPTVHTMLASLLLIHELSSEQETLLVGSESMRLEDINAHTTFILRRYGMVP